EEYRLPTTATKFPRTSRFTVRPPRACGASHEEDMRGARVRRTSGRPSLTTRSSGGAAGRELRRDRPRKEEEDRMSIRKLGANKRWPLLMVVAMFLSGISPSFMPQSTVSAQVVAGGAPVGQGFVIDAGDLRFIYEQILVAQAHAAGGTLLGPGPNQVSDPQLPRGLRTVDGSYNNLVPVPDQHMFGAA